MSIRFNLPDETRLKAEKIIKENYRSILLNTKLVGARVVNNWADYLTADHVHSSNISISKETNMVSFERLGVTNKLVSLVKDLFPNKKVRPSGFWHYPPTGFMGWHTNRNDPCERMYLTWTNESNKSFFRYIKDDQVITDYDEKGLTCRKFMVTGHPPFLWHCVGSEIDRLSFGFAIQ